MPHTRNPGARGTGAREVDHAGEPIGPENIPPSSAPQAPSAIGFNNRLPVLAIEIAAEHSAARKAGREFLEHVVAAGQCLIEAKELIGHGNWQAWLAAKVPDVSIRTSQKYMKAARLAGKNDAGSFLSMRHLLEGAKGHPKRPDPESDPWAWGEWQLAAPFNKWDFDSLDEWNWIRTKLVHKFALPAPVAMFLGCADEYGVPALRLASIADLSTALQTIAPVALGKAVVPINSEGMTHWELQAAMITIMITGRRIVCALWDECEHPSRRNPEKYCASFDKVIAELLATLDKRLAEHRAGQP